MTTRRSGHFETHKAEARLEDLEFLMNNGVKTHEALRRVGLTSRHALESFLRYNKRLDILAGLAANEVTDLQLAA